MVILQGLNHDKLKAQEKYAFSYPFSPLLLAVLVYCLEMSVSAYVSDWLLIITALLILIVCVCSYLYFCWRFSRMNHANQVNELGGIVAYTFYTFIMFAISAFVAWMAIFIMGVASL